ncbi:MAG TPA: aminoacyl-tRNA hydrolase [Candidatus Pacebacteria bacterium]|nr:aminoacyl-tRNA hydrolase [Candidatus Paceibacterota bacterium]
MKLIIGLGNPGKEYEKTRHNAGFVFLNALQEQYELPEFSYSKKFNSEINEGYINATKYILAKPQTFMNRSGESVRALIDFYKIKPEDIIVIADDLDIEIGKYKISKGTRAAGHNGIQNIIDILGTQNFTRIRIGIESAGGRCERGQIPGDKFVLQRFTDEEIALFQNTIQEILKKLQQQI